MDEEEGGKASLASGRRVQDPRVPRGTLLLRSHLAPHPLLPGNPTRNPPSLASPSL